MSPDASADNYHKGEIIMEIHLDHELELLKKELTIMCNQSAESLVLAIRALRDRDLELAENVIKSDHDIDMLENKIDGMILAVLALQQPFAIDLRFITSAMKINNDLERVADKAVSIARSVESMLSEDYKDTQVETLLEMGTYSLDMIKKAFTCFVNQDARSAQEVIAADKALDKMNRDAYSTAIKTLSKTTENADLGLNIYRIATSLERIGDLAKNISEEAIYYIKGEIVKHGGAE